MRKCAICDKKYMPGNGTFFQIPKDEERRRKWNEICKKNFAPSTLICIDHFSPSDMVISGKMKVLLPKALPIVDRAFPQASVVINKSLNIIDDNIVPLSFPKDNFKDFSNYTKCGEILKSPFSNYQKSIILKCFECNEVHFQLESFVKHIEDHFKDLLSPDEQILGEQYENEYELDGEAISIDWMSTKLEDLEDPLKPAICDEINQEKSVEEEDLATENMDITSIVFDYNEFEISDNPDEYQHNESETEEREETDIIEFDTKEDIESTEIEKFMQSKLNVTTLIDSFKKQPHLWKETSPFYRLKDKRKQFLEEITEEINKKQNLNYTWKQTEEIISYICRKYLNDLRQLECNKAKFKNSEKGQSNYDRRNENKHKCNWYFDQLSFLKSKVLTSLQKIDTNMPDLTPEQIIKILKIYQRFPHLWNTYLIENICSNKRHDAHIEMLKVLETEMNLKISVNALEEYIRTIHNYFSKKKRRRLNISKKNELENEFGKTDDDWQYYCHLSFLEDHEGPFNCPECHSTYMKPLCYRVHKSQHDDTIPLSCSQCNKEFKSIVSYTTHAKRHLEDFHFICKECNKKFLRHSDLEIHMFTHTGFRPYCCEICGASYRRKDILVIIRKTDIRITLIRI